MEQPIIYIDPKRGRELDMDIALQKARTRSKEMGQPTIHIDPQKAYDLDREITLQEIYYRPEGYYQNAERLRDACRKAGYNFPLITIKKWLEPQKMHQIYRPSPKNAPYAIEIPYDDEDNLDNSYRLMNTQISDEDYTIFYYVLLVEDCASRFKDFIFLTSKNSSEVADAFRSIYDNPTKPLIYPRLLQCDENRSFMGDVTLLMNEYNVEIRRIKARFRHTSLAILNNYAGLFTRRVFKNQYAVEFLIPDGKRCRECERFARKIVDDMNDTPTRQIGMSPNNAIKLERVYSKPC
ncbi:hypothetical protein Glove_26g309 [Diversispora epigaea]|uniref:Integrase catalytic domain-containing protein n=1 Tax=Diversispora epigaea TaxID=1348612 RepID=A0A397JPR9_9GLOM|nr:hypothetical protein Glove_26g309 [Diversispora epigaea]